MINSTFKNIKSDASLDLYNDIFRFEDITNSNILINKSKFIELNTEYIISIDI